MDKHTRQLIKWFMVWMLLQIICFKIEGAIGGVLLVTGTALMLMYAWAEYKLEQARKQERRKVIECARRIKKAYQTEAHDVEM